MQQVLFHTYWIVGRMQMPKSKYQPSMLLKESFDNGVMSPSFYQLLFLESSNALMHASWNSSSLFSLLAVFLCSPFFLACSKAMVLSRLNDPDTDVRLSIHRWIYGMAFHLQSADTVRGWLKQSDMLQLYVHHAMTDSARVIEVQFAEFIAASHVSPASLIDLTLFPVPSLKHRSSMRELATLNDILDHMHYYDKIHDCMIMDCY